MKHLPNVAKKQAARPAFKERDYEEDPQDINEFFEDLHAHKEEKRSRYPSLDLNTLEHEQRKENSSMSSSKPLSQAKKSVIGSSHLPVIINKATKSVSKDADRNTLIGIGSSDEAESKSSPEMHSSKKKDNEEKERRKLEKKEQRQREKEMEREREREKELKKERKEKKKREKEDQSDDDLNGQGKTEYLYQFRPNMARIIGYTSWGTEKQIKKAIQSYAKSRGIYNKEKKRLEVARYGIKVAYLIN